MEIILGQKGNANAAKESVVVRHLYIYIPGLNSTWFSAMVK